MLVTWKPLGLEWLQGVRPRASVQAHGRWAGTWQRLRQARVSERPLWGGPGVSWPAPVTGSVIGTSQMSERKCVCH